jgi:hypothetical protein
MIARLGTVILVSISFATSAPTLAQGAPQPKVITIDQIDCRDWRKLPGGLWGPTREIQIKLRRGGTIGMGPQSSFSALPVDGINLAALLDQLCAPARTR